LPGAVDAALAVVRDGDVVTITVEFMRDGAEGTQVVLRKKMVEVGEDANGRPLTSLVLERHDGDEADHTSKKQEWPSSLKVLKDAIVEALLEAGEDYQIEGGPKVRAVELGKLRRAFYDSYIVASEDAASAERQQDSKRKAFIRAVEKAQTRRLIGARAFPNGRQIVWLVTPFEGGYAP
jgi:hypothetical protein